MHAQSYENLFIGDITHLKLCENLHIFDSMPETARWLHHGCTQGLRRSATRMMGKCRKPETDRRLRHGCAQSPRRSATRIRGSAESLRLPAAFITDVHRARDVPPFARGEAQKASDCPQISLWVCTEPENLVASMEPARVVAEAAEPENYGTGSVPSLRLSADFIMDVYRARDVPPFACGEVQRA